MTKAEWMVCTDPMPMLEFLRGMASGRKLRLFARAACRTVWHVLPDKRSWKAIEVPERVAGHLVSPGELAAAEAAGDHEEVDQQTALLWAKEAVAAARGTGNRELQRQCNLLRDIFGHVIGSKTVNPSWRRWNYGCLVHLAQAIYDQRRFEDLPRLAVGLSQAGCTDEGILAHCREPGEHVRGCWVVDLLLGKE